MPEMASNTTGVGLDVLSHANQRFSNFCSYRRQYEEFSSHVEYPIPLIGLIDKLPRHPALFLLNYLPLVDLIKMR
jgi:hypothetical protein